VYRLPVLDERDRTLRLLSATVSADLDDVAADAARDAATGEVDIDFVEALAVNRGSHCKACPLRNKCRDDAYAGGDLTVLSKPTRAAAAVAGTTTRAASVAAGATRPAPHEEGLAADAAAVRTELRDVGWSPRRFTA
jgi:hypothetical protein